MIILGVDPGSTRVGFGLVEKRGGAFSMIDCGILKIFSKEKTSRFLEMEKEFSAVIKKYKPDLVAIEKIFFSKNQKTAIEVAESRGILTLIAAKHKIALSEFTPLEVKQNISGYGKADKKTVSRMVANILKVDKIKGYDDISDALAIAIVAGYRHRFDGLLKTERGVKEII